jgi:eukaryotic-like serine/threonine-protein kinase
VLIVSPTTNPQFLAANDGLPFSIGDLLAGKYRVERVLGIGGMGVVVAAMHVDLERMVAVKVIRRELAKDEDNVQRLLLEARSAARIRSEHVGKVLDVGRLESGEPYIVMEYLHGYDLARYLEQKQRLETVEAVELLLQACDAIVEAHDAGIVHRDLKPENLFLTPLKDESHLVKVLDFGISKHLTETRERALTTPQTAIGSPQYMAPEQMQADAIDTRVDVWSLGAILYEMLAGQPAFMGDSLPAVCARVLSADPLPLREIAPHTPPEVAAVVHACLQKDRQRRLPDVRTLVDMLAPFGGAQSRLLHGRIVGRAHAQTHKLDSSVSQRVVTPSPTLGEVPPSASQDVRVNRSLSRRPIFLSMLAVVGLSLGAFWLARGTTMRTRSPTAAASAGVEITSTPPVPVTPAAVPSAASPAQLPLPAASPALAPTENAAALASVSVAVTEAPVPALSGRSLTPAIRPRPLGNPAAPKQVPATTSALDKAWNPDSFGGRH